MPRMTVRSEHDIHERREVGVISRKALFGVMPMMQFRRTDQHPQRPERQSHVGMNIDRPDPAKRGETGERREIKT